MREEKRRGEREGGRRGSEWDIEMGAGEAGSGEGSRQRGGREADETQE